MQSIPMHLLYILYTLLVPFDTPSIHSLYTFYTISIKLFLPFLFLPTLPLPNNPPTHSLPDSLTHSLQRSRSPQTPVSHDHHPPSLFPSLFTSNFLSLLSAPHVLRPIASRGKSKESSRAETAACPAPTSLDRHNPAPLPSPPSFLLSLSLCERRTRDRY